MNVTVVGFGVMREYLPEGESNRAELDLPDGADVEALLTRLGVPPRLVHVCLVDGERVGLDRALPEGAEVTLMPPFSGGAA